MTRSVSVEYLEKEVKSNLVRNALSLSGKAECKRRCPNVAGDTRTSAETADRNSFFRDPVDGGCTFVVPTRPVGTKAADDQMRPNITDLPQPYTHDEPPGLLAAQHNQASDMLPAPTTTALSLPYYLLRSPPWLGHHHITQTKFAKCPSATKKYLGMTHIQISAKRDCYRLSFFSRTIISWNASTH